MMPTISVILITKNEAANIRDCLQSVAWADEIIVVDSGSTDGTLQIAKEMGAQVYAHDWPGFGPQKNRALAYASKDWIFSIDADERVTPALRAELEQAMQSGQADGYFCPRLSQFCGTFIHHSGWHPDYVLRLFKRGRGCFSDSLVHESIVLQGTSTKLKTSLLHYSYLTMQDVERKVIHYSDAAAQQMMQAGKQTNWARAAISAGWAFMRTYIVRMGVLDGSAGFQIALMNMRTTYLKYRKLAALHASQR
jgi:glycosyltransferase involved in cell wall biosynthesis